MSIVQLHRKKRKDKKEKGMRKILMQNCRSIVCESCCD